MKKYNIVFVFLSILLVSSCTVQYATVKYYDDIKKPESSIQYHKSYEMPHQKQIASVGDVFISLQKYWVTESPGYYPTKNIDFPVFGVGGGKDPKIDTNQCWVAKGETKYGTLLYNYDFSKSCNDEYYAALGSYFQRADYVLEVSDSGKVQDFVLKLGDKPFYNSAPTGKSRPKGVLFKKQTKEVYSFSRNTYKLIYMGKIGTVVKFQYEEYTEDVARTESFKTFEYDLSDGYDIEFKGVQIHIDSCTSSIIEYRITNDDAISRWVL